jgi:hypothetical protein
MKYIRFENPAQSAPSFILFVAPLTHADVADMVRGSGLKPASAGYYDPAAGACFGESSTLKLKPAAGDSKILAAMARATLATCPDKPAPEFSIPRADLERFRDGAPRDHLTGQFTTP